MCKACKNIKINKRIYNGMRAAIALNVPVVCQECNQIIEVVNVGLGDEIIVDGKLAKVINNNTDKILV